MSSESPEFSRMIDARAVDGRQLVLTASGAECAALARRFALVGVDGLEATVLLARDGADISADGRLTARIVQPCAVSGEDLPVSIDEPLHIRFVPAGDSGPAEEIEISADDCDEIPYSGAHIDLGEAVAQTLGLAIDPYASGEHAEAARAGLIAPAGGAFAGLAKLKLGKD